MIDQNQLLNWSLRGLGGIVNLLERWHNENIILSAEQQATVTREAQRLLSIGQNKMVAQPEPPLTESARLEIAAAHELLNPRGV